LPSSKEFAKNRIILAFNKQSVQTELNANINIVIECALNSVINHYKTFEEFINDTNMEATLVKILEDCNMMFAFPLTWSDDFKNKFVDNLVQGSATRTQAICILDKIIDKYRTPQILMKAITEQCESKDNITCPKQFFTDFIANSECINVSETGCSAKTLRIHQTCIQKPDLCQRYNSLGGCMGLNGWQGDGDTTDCVDYIKKTGKQACLY